MVEKKKSESFCFLVAVAVVGTVIGGIILAMILSDGFRAVVLAILSHIWTALDWFVTASFTLPLWLIVLLCLIALWSIGSAVARNSEKKRRDSEEFKTSFHRYVTDTFDGVTWTWRYYGDRPTALYPICARDHTPMVYTRSQFVESPTYMTQFKIWLHCETCGRETVKELGGENEIINEKIERQILRKIHSNEYLKVLKAQDAA